MEQGLDTRKWNAMEAGRAARDFGESNAPESRPVARIARKTATGKPLASGQHRFPSRSFGVMDWAREPV